MERTLIIFSSLLLLFIITLNFLINTFDFNRKEIAWNISRYWREFVIPTEYKENDFFVKTSVPEITDFYDNTLIPHKKTFYVLKSWKTVANLSNLPSDSNWYFDKQLLFKQENNKHLEAFRTLYENTKNVCTLNWQENIICRNIH